MGCYIILQLYLYESNENTSSLFLKKLCKQTLWHHYQSLKIYLDLAICQPPDYNFSLPNT